MFTSRASSFLRPAVALTRAGTYQPAARRVPMAGFYPSQMSPQSMALENRFFPSASAQRLIRQPSAWHALLSQRTPGPITSAVQSYARAPSVTGSTSSDSRASSVAGGSRVRMSEADLQLAIANAVPAPQQQVMVTVVTVPAPAPAPTHVVPAPPPVSAASVSLGTTADKPFCMEIELDDLSDGAVTGSRITRIEAGNKMELRARAMAWLRQQNASQGEVKMVMDALDKLSS